jgi:acyl dehydratase
MSSTLPVSRGLYFEEFEVGQTLVSAGRTITETDVVRFAGISGDYNQLHTDAEYGKKTPFGARVAHGLLVLSIASGLAMRTGVLEGTAIAFREINHWKFIKPVYFGDTVHVVLEVVETKAIPRLNGGSVVIQIEVRNQKDETVMKGTWTTLVVSKPQEN